MTFTDKEQPMRFRLDQHLKACRLLRARAAKVTDPELQQAMRRKANSLLALVKLAHALDKRRASGSQIAHPSYRYHRKEMRGP